MKKQLVIFDLDGTLLDTLTDISMSMNEALSRLQFPPFPKEEYKTKVGSGVSVLVDRCLPSGASEASKLALKKEFLAIYRNNVSTYTKPYPGIPELLEELCRRQMNLAIASNKPHAETLQTVQHFFKQVPFSPIYGLREGYAPKPDPTIVQDILSALNIDAKEALYIGDSSVDMQTARAAGVYAVGCTWGFRSTKELLENGADALVHHAHELVVLLDNNRD